MSQTRQRTFPTRPTVHHLPPPINPIPAVKVTIILISNATV